jgi:hypothetical protein
MDYSLGSIAFELTALLGHVQTGTKAIKMSLLATYRSLISDMLTLLPHLMLH